MPTYFSGGYGPVYGGDWRSQQWEKVLYVSSVNTNKGDGNDGLTPDRPLASIGGATGALYKAGTTGLGTLIIVGRGHTENIATADAWSLLGTATNVKLLGEGDETDRPTLTWTTAASTCLFDTNGLGLDNFNLNLDGGTTNTTTAAPITISGNGCLWRNLKIRGGTDANNKVTVGITVTGSDVRWENIHYYGATAATATTHVRLNGANRFKATDLVIDAATSAVGVGSLQFLTTASTKIWMERFFIANRLASSTAAVSGLAGCDGYVARGHLHVTANTASELTSAWGTKASVQFGPDVVVTNDVGENGTNLLAVSV